MVNLRKTNRKLENNVRTERNYVREKKKEEEVNSIKTERKAWNFIKKIRKKKKGIGCNIKMEELNLGNYARKKEKGNRKK